MGDDVGRINAEPFDVFGAVGFQKGAVITTDIQNQVAGFELSNFFRHVRDSGKIIPHGLIDAGTVPVGGIKHSRRDRMSHLNQTTGILVEGRVAAHQIEWNAALHRWRAVRFGERAADILIAEGNDRRQFAASAQAACLSGNQNG